MNNDMLKIFTWMLVGFSGIGIQTLHAEVVLTTFTLDTPTNLVNRFNMELSLNSSLFNAQDTDVSTASGQLTSNITIDYALTTRDVTISNLQFVPDTPGKVLLTDANFLLDLPFPFADQTARTRNLKTTMSTPNDGPVSPGGGFPMNYHRAIINSGTFSYSGLISGSGDTAVQPLIGPGQGTGNLIVERLISSDTWTSSTYRLNLSAPIQYYDSSVTGTSPIPYNVIFTATGTFSGSATINKTFEPKFGYWDTSDDPGFQNDSAQWTTLSEHWNVSENSNGKRLSLRNDLIAVFPGPNPAPISVVGSVTVGGLRFAAPDCILQSGTIFIGNESIHADYDAVISSQLDFSGASNGLTKEGNGILTIQSPVTWGSASILKVAAGTLKFELSSANTIPALVIVDNGATLTLGGVGNALSNGIATHANVTNEGTLAATTAGRRVGNIDGTGTTIVTETGATLTANSIRQAGLSIGDGNKVTVATNGGNSGTSVVTNLNINATGKLDLNNNDLVVHNGNLATLTAQLATGLDINGGYGNGPGITSSAFANNVNFNTVLGIAANIELGYTSFSGQTVDTNDVLIKYTYYGDADLNGLVDTSTDFDLYITGLTSGGSLGGWLYGDFDYNGTVDSATDFDLYITGLTTQGGTLLIDGGGESLVQTVPEPSTMVLWALASIGLVGELLRRRRLQDEATSASSIEP